jgi:hypothetical protein
MNEHRTHRNPSSLDELLLSDWAAEGIAALERYLAKHAAFAAYLTARDGLDSAHGDGAER